MVVVLPPLPAHPCGQVGHFDLDLTASIITDRRDQTRQRDLPAARREFQHIVDGFGHASTGWHVTPPRSHRRSFHGHCKKRAVPAARTAWPAFAWR
jgi:hypothetical protein